MSRLRNTGLEAFKARQGHPQGQHADEPATGWANARGHLSAAAFGLEVRLHQQFASRPMLA